MYLFFCLLHLHLHPSRPFPTCRPSQPTHLSSAAAFPSHPPPTAPSASPFLFHGCFFPQDTSLPTTTTRLYLRSRFFFSLSATYPIPFVLASRPLPQPRQASPDLPRAHHHMPPSLRHSANPRRTVDRCMSYGRAWSPEARPPLTTRPVDSSRPAQPSAGPRRATRSELSGNQETNPAQTKTSWRTPGALFFPFRSVPLFSDSMTSALFLFFLFRCRLACFLHMCPPHQIDELPSSSAHHARRSISERK
ncbi:uncharacterized protein J3D65DRAFT_620136 [Phyllosticta citribraziliensis]|uniref:Uncharacterized protein n=1 Tax=Phyllosticta citribraziliensis TaxID=989973 RepID=A0ABR1LZ58_9PEZI